MLKKIRGYFGLEGGDNISLLEAKDHTRLAVATVLLSAARVDGHLSGPEKDLLVKQLENRLNISGSDARALEAQAELSETKHLLSKFAETLRVELSVAQREFILTLAWSIISEDRVVAEQESRFAAELRHKLGLSIEQSIRARKSAEGLTHDGFKEFVESSQEMNEGIKQHLSRMHPART